jgi:hypothetical protein
MSNLETLQARLETFREAGHNLQLDPLVTRQDWERLGVEYQMGLIDELPCWQSWGLDSPRSSILW